MQYINKQNTEPEGWNDWFSYDIDGQPRQRSYNWRRHEDFFNKNAIKEYLLDEQFYLCAYCQKKIDTNSTSIEHVIPKSLNIQLSTNYHNLVAVCKQNNHCDKFKLEKPIAPLIFLNDCQVTENQNNAYFQAKESGVITAKNDNELAQNFLNVTNLNYEDLVSSRNLALNKLIKSAVFSRTEFKIILRNILLETITAEYREFILIYLQTKLGIN